MATAASYFSGATIMPSQRRSSASAPDPSAASPSPSPSKSRDPRFSGSVPVTVRHIARSLAAAAAGGGGDSALSIDGIETSNVRVLGRVVDMVDKETDVSFTLDDGTGRIALVRWIAEQPDAREAAYVQNGAYVRVHVNLQGFKAKRQALVRSIRSVSNFNEVVRHFIECMHVHLENVRQKVQGQLPPVVQTHTSTVAPFSGGVREHQVHYTQANQFTAYPGTGGKWNDLQKMVLEVLQEPDILVLEHGVHIDDVVRRLGIPKTNILEVIRYLVDVGLIYSTIDDNHFKSVQWLSNAVPSRIA